jgi:murein DD-endopeptidase MepM/ murein hydrolase activator NlpD
MRRSVVFKVGVPLDTQLWIGRETEAGERTRNAIFTNKKIRSRVAGIGFRLRLTKMPGMLAIQFPYAFLLAAAAGPDALPAGNDPAFHLRDADIPVEAPAPSEPRSMHIVAAVALPRLSSRFGYRVDPLRGGRAMHDGVDIPGPLGSPVRAADSGTVQFAGVAGGYGNMVEIAHPGGLATRYGHLLRMLVRPGAHVEQGEVIALMGSTGRSTGSHLHFEVRTRGHAIDPLGVLGTAPAWREGSPVSAPGAPHVSAFARARAAAGAEPGDR